MKKFEKNRSVWSKWLNVPIKYMLTVEGANKGSSAKTVPLTIKEDYDDYIENFESFKWDDDEVPLTFEQYKESVEKYKKLLGEDCKLYEKTKQIPAKHDKTFCIIEMSKKWATCGWRNNQTCSIGMPIKCRIVKKGKKVGIMYREKFYQINTRSGWVF